MQASYLYASGSAAILTTKLLSDEKDRRAAASKDTDEALRLLFEAGYADGVAMTSADFEDTLAAQMRQAAEFVSENTADRAATDCFLLRADYLNAKMAMKCKYARKTPTAYAYGGLFDGQKLFESLSRDDYSALPPEMAEALGKIDEKFFEGDRNPAVVDDILDTAYYGHVSALLKNCGSKAVKDYFAAEADTKNLINFFRYLKAGFGKETFDGVFAACGKIPRGFFDEMFASNGEKAAENLPCDEYRDFLEILLREYKSGVAMAESEARAADLKKKIMYSAKDNIEGIEPLVYYYLGKQTETENIRLILVCLKNRVDKKEIVKRLRESYV